QRDSHVRHQIDTALVTYHKHSLADNTPSDATSETAKAQDYPAKVEGNVTRNLPSQNFDDHFSQARMFWNSMSAVEQQDIIKSFSYHLGKVKDPSIRQQTVDMFVNVDQEMANAIDDKVDVNRTEDTHVDVDISLSSLRIP